jgi:hypothetical protein
MPGDVSRKTFRKEQHYSGVLEQQGRVQTDADWNEQLDIQLYRTHTEATDVIGQSGVPKKNDGFKIGVASGGHDLTISAGRIYVEGLLCELDDPATYTAQPYLPNPEFTGPSSPPSSPPHSSLSLEDGTYLVLLDAWQREITALDDKLIREVALGGPDTTTRLQNVWQVKLLKVNETSPPADCDTQFAQFDQYTQAGSGKLNARAEPVEPGNNPCVLPPQAGYNRLENQLYRVEIHTGGPLNQATFKWSRDNGSVETKIKEISGSLLKVADTGKDEVLNFAGGQWVEIVDDESTLKGKPNALVQIDKIGPGPNQITLKTTADQFKNLSGLKVRRWDQSNGNATSSGISAALSDVALDKWIELEGGVQVQFSDGDYRAGDYWLIPARTTTGEIEWPPYEIPNKNPIAQSPQGIRHHYCRLALIHSNGGVIIEPIDDCRKLFPAITEICAEDICFDNNKCDFAGAETVQDALDRLCAARDLRFHNKHLHGWGIVCGLQVQCGPDASNAQRRHVTVRPGYAIDCEGNDIILEANEKIDLLEMITLTLPPSSPPSSPPGSVKDGDVCLILEGRDKDARFRLEPKPQPKQNWQALLAGTLLADVIQDCVMSLIDFFKDEFTVPPGEEKGLVGPTQKRITTFGNLLIQLINTENGSFVYLSGERGQSSPNSEDTILRNFYNKLREKLQSHTFCAMFEDARPFPDYPLEYSQKELATIFGKGYQSRLRVSPNGVLGYSVGASNKINVYHLGKGEMVAELEFPGGTSAIVRDVAFSQDGKQLYAAATLDDRDSMFAVADVSGTKHTWRKPAMTCDVPLVSLGTWSKSKHVFAIGKGKGLYEIDPLNVAGKPTPIYQFSATGHLVIDDQDGMAFATSGNASTPDSYDAVQRLNLAKQDPPVIFHQGVGGGNFAPGEDDIALLGDGDNGRLYVVSGSSNKQAVVFRSMDTAANPIPLTFVALGEDTTIRLAHNPLTKFMMVTYEDSYRVGLITADNKLVTNYRHPVQISPRSIAVSPDQKNVYVLNYASNTITSIPAGLLDPKNQIPLKPLVDYRADVINAFADLLGGLIQYLKDCFCEHFLVDCPTCDEDDKLYLACITIKDGQVFKVCNFSLRKYVHTFPTVEYWLSVIPIIPLISKAIETFCCAALPAFFSKYNAPKPEATEGDVKPGSNTLKSNTIYGGVSYVQQTDFRGAVARTMADATPARKLLTDFVTNKATQAAAPTQAGTKPIDVADKPAGDVKKKLEESKIKVEKVEEYDAKHAGRNLIKFAQAPANLQEGMRVNLITKDDKVLFYTLADEPPEHVAELRDQFEAGLATVESLRNDVVASKATVEENKAALEKISPQVEELRAKVEADTFANKTVLDQITPQLENLRSKVDADSAILAASKATIEQALPQLKTLNAAVEANRAALDKSSPQIAELRARLDATTAAIAETKTSLGDAVSLREQVTSLRAELLSVRQTHQQELAARDKDIADLRLNFNNAQKVIGTINERIRKLPPG